MRESCIICGQPAGSGEHLFPAALGGRRTNKGIYCKTHNEGFSPLVVVLNNQLREINSFLSVRPDRKKIPHSFELLNKQNESFVISGTSITYARPMVTESSNPDGTVTSVVKVSSRAEADKWIHEQRKLGHDVKVTSIERGSKLFTEGFSVSLDFGGADGLRAIGYLALTYLAHYFPDIASYGNLNDFKNYILGNSENEYVWWLSESPIEKLAEDPFEFGHSIALCLNSSNNETYAAVSLFSALNFAVRFGAIEPTRDETVITHINPLAERAPDDILESKDDSILFDVVMPDDLKDHLEFNIQSGLSQVYMQRLFNKIGARGLRLVSGTIYTKIMSINATSLEEAEKEIQPIIHGERQRLLNLLVFALNELRPKFIDQFGKLATDRAFSIVKSDENGTDGVSATTQKLLKLATRAVASELSRKFVAKELDAETISMMIGGGPGAASVLSACYKDLENSIVNEVKKLAMERRLKTSVSWIAFARARCI